MQSHDIWLSGLSLSIPSVETLEQIFQKLLEGLERKGGRRWKSDVKVCKAAHML